VALACCMCLTGPWYGRLAHIISSSARQHGRVLQWLLCGWQNSSATYGRLTVSSDRVKKASMFWQYFPFHYVRGKPSAVQW